MKKTVQERKVRQREQSEREQRRLMEGCSVKVEKVKGFAESSAKYLLIALRETG